jgi:hypothetical protein
MVSDLTKWKKMTPFLVTMTVAVVVGLQSLAEYKTAEAYSARFDFLPPDHLPLAASDCYKWGNILRADWGDWVDRSEDPRATGEVMIQWASPTRLYLSVVHMAFSTVLPPTKAEAWTLFFSMPILSILLSLSVSLFALYSLRSVCLSILLPPALVLLPEIQSQLLAGRPDHHGPIIFAVSLFVLSLFQSSQKQNAWVFSSVFATLALWLSPLNFIPILGLVSLAFAFPKAFPLPELAPASPLFWRKWSWSVFWMSLTAWASDYLPRGSQIHMETLNPFWSAALLGGGVSLSLWISPPPRPWNCRTWVSTMWPPILLTVPLIMLFSPSLFWPSSEEIGWILKEVREMKPGDVSVLFTALPLVFITLMISCSLPKHKGLPILVVVALLSSLLFLWQIRWLPLSILTPVVFLTAPLLLFPPPKRWGRLVSLALVGSVLWVGTSTLSESLERINNPKGYPEMYNVAMYAAIASRLAKEGGEELILATPNLTSGLFFMNGVKSIGSVYWESKNNLRFAAEVFGSLPSDEKRVRETLQKHDIRLLAITPQVLDTAYIGLSGNWSNIDQSLVVRLMKGEVPPWLKTVARMNQPWPGLGLYEVID